VVVTDHRLHLLQNPAYKGQAAYGKTRTVHRRQRLRPLRGRPIHPRHDHSTAVVDQQDWISIPVPALVDEYLFDAAQEQLPRIARGRAKAGGILVVFSRALRAAVAADMHITPKGCDNEALADNLSILFTTAAPALTVIDSAVGGYARIPRS
jgi:hypothetical protein